MKNIDNATLISSTLKTIASENLVTEQELTDAKDKPLEEILNEAKKATEQSERD